MPDDPDRELIPVSIRRPSHTQGTSQAFVVSLDDVVSAPDLHERLQRAERAYRDSLVEWRGLMEEIKRNRADPVPRWRLAELVEDFQGRISADWGLEPTNYRVAVSLDIGISKSALDYILRLRSRFPVDEVENLGMNWSKFQEVLDIKDDARMRECLDLIRLGRIRFDTEIRAFKRQANAGMPDPLSA